MSSSNEPKPTDIMSDTVHKLCFGLAAAETAAMLAILSLQTTSAPLSITLYCACFSIPVLVINGFTLHNAIGVTYSDIKRTLSELLTVLAMAASLVGFAALPFHFGQSFGIVFVLGVLATFAAPYLQRWRRTVTK